MTSAQGRRMGNRREDDPDRREPAVAVTETDADAVSRPPERGPYIYGCLREINRVLKRNGLLSIAEFKVGDPHFIPECEMPGMIQSAGFRVRARYGRWLHYTVNCSKKID